MPHHIHTIRKPSFELESNDYLRLVDVVNGSCKQQHNKLSRIQSVDRGVFKRVLIWLLCVCAQVFNFSGYFAGTSFSVFLIESGSGLRLIPIQKNYSLFCKFKKILFFIYGRVGLCSATFFQHIPSTTIVRLNPIQTTKAPINSRSQFYWKSSLEIWWINVDISIHWLLPSSYKINSKFILFE